MTRFEQKPTPALYAAIAASAVTVFVADLLTPVGLALWIFYLVPVALALFLWRPGIPLVLGALITVLMLMGFLFSPQRGNWHMAVFNRAFGLLTLWGVAAIAHLFIRNKLIVRKEHWVQSGQTRLSEVLRGDQPMDQLGENVLRFLAGYLDAHAGAFFFADADGFRRFASYAVPAHSDVPERIRPGEGLVGQAVKDGRAFVLRDVPEGYFSIGSALGQYRPRHLLVTPVTADRMVNGVLELALVHPVYGSDIDLLDHVAESIGIAIRSATDRTRLQELFDETQRQAQELQTQSEELRISNEELAEQSRVLKESQTRLELQQAQLQQTNQQLSEQARRLEEQNEDLTRAKAELEHKTRELEQTSRYKSDFLANMSHELRTPLNSSLILAKLLAENRPGNLTPEQIQYAQTIESAGNDLLTLITDILDLSKIEAGRMEVKAQAVPLARLLENLGRTFQPLAADKALQFRTQIAPGTPETLETDPQKLEQVLKNILSNAIKFTEQGEVVLEVSRAAGERVEFSVRDTGIGVPAHQHDVIFEPFRQADGTTNRKYGGTGLGLSISRELVQLLGGSIELVSEEGHGSTFTISVPRVYDSGRDSREPTVPMPVLPEARPPARGQPQASPLPAQAAASAPLRDDRLCLTGGRRVALVIEDDASFARILYDLAHELGFQCLVAATAEEGLVLAWQHSPSAVLLDVGLPDNSGLAVLDQLKRDARTRHIPVHVISASEHSQAALAMGAVGCMLKPVQRAQLVEAFKRLETRLTQRVRRVLVVEDDPVQLDSLRRLLGSREVETLGAQSAAECLETLKAATVDCMVLDLNLPDASGFSLLETLSHENGDPFPPVIIYTGRDLSGDEEQRLRRYSKSIIIKGAKSPERLLDEVTLFLHQVVAELPPVQQRLLEKSRSRDAVLEGRQILVVEDDVRNVFALTSVLEPRGATVAIARNGREALAALERSAQPPARPVDLVLMDIMMPEMDGFTAMREIRRRPEWRKLPMIALTAKAMSSDQQECLAAGANDYLAKPLDIEKLLSLIRVWMPQ